MKQEHIKLVWESLEDFDKANITFGVFLDHLGKAMESATLLEAKMIGEAIRNIDFAMISGSNNDLKRVITTMKSDFVPKFRTTDA